ncbi:hypothetical protein B0H17DRAFT_1209147 [Mycena rosella]|uniref:Uncharacterized protein n=1 Tax=Mycena rosella TaxID=1033263 RepID=A0AAD7G628_MYCRO|nr:hypothetical protein B0H17DRAFT_1209147 [Mycena rosella]
MSPPPRPPPSEYLFFYNDAEADLPVSAAVNMLCMHMGEAAVTNIPVEYLFFYNDAEADPPVSAAVNKLYIGPAVRQKSISTLLLSAHTPSPTALSSSPNSTSRRVVPSTTALSSSLTSTFRPHPLLDGSLLKPDFYFPPRHPSWTALFIKLDLLPPVHHPLHVGAPHYANLLPPSMTALLTMPTFILMPNPVPPGATPHPRQALPLSIISPA